jgi:hypothetical protein
MAAEGDERLNNLCVRNYKLQSVALGVVELLSRQFRCFGEMAHRRKRVAEDVPKGATRNWVLDEVQKLTRSSTLLKTHRQPETGLEVEQSAREHNAFIGLKYFHWTKTRDQVMRIVALNLDRGTQFAKCRSAFLFARFGSCSCGSVVPSRLLLTRGRVSGPTGKEAGSNSNTPRRFPVTRGKRRQRL